MSKLTDDQEPSMEEILSSIRRIIADDDDEAGSSGVPVDPRTVAGEVKPQAKSAPQQTVAVLDDEDELELTEVVEEDEAMPPAMKETVEDEVVFAEPDEDVDLDEFEELAPAPRPESRRKPAVAAALAADDALISTPAAKASTSAFAKLAKAAAGKETPPLEGGDKTVEAFLVELLKPMLKDWLDANLQGVVERVVEQEVKKLARRAELM